MHNPNTEVEYNAIIDECAALFLKKAADYGTAWRVMRLPSLTDQIFIKAKRLRSIEDNKGVQQVADDVRGEYIGLINYSLIALIQLELDENAPLELPIDEVKNAYLAQAATTRNLMLAKNHDYGEAWRDMRVSSFTDLILMKILRIKQIEDHAGKTLVSEGVSANYQDIINYSVFAMIGLGG
jgi:Nucleotide modification associated domain 1